MFMGENWKPQTVGDGLPDVPFGQRFMRAVEDASPYRLVRLRRINFNLHLYTYNILWYNII